MAATKKTAGEKYELTRDQLLAYVEMDLWGRFQKRLWAVVGIVLTSITVAGFLGVPYYIRSEVDQKLKASTLQFEKKSADLLAHTKLLIVVTAKYEDARMRLHSDIYRTMRSIDELAAKQEATKDSKDKTDWRFRSIKSELSAILSRPSTESPLGKTRWMTHAISGDEEKLTIMPQKMIIQELSAGTASTRTMSGHPVNDGSIRGALQDIRYQAVIVEALGLVVDEISTRIRSFGGTSDTDARIEEAKVVALDKGIFQPVMKRSLIESLKRHLDDEELKKFGETSVIYMAGILDQFELPSNIRKSGESDQRASDLPVKQR